MAYTTEQIEGITVTLRERPPVEKKKRQHSKQEAVTIRSREIAKMQKRGYTLGQTAEVLRGAGLDITERTLRRYLEQCKQASKKTPAQAAGDTPPTPQPEANGDIEEVTQPATDHQENVTAQTAQ